jgi:FkbM family methyltransferase
MSCVEGSLGSNEEHKRQIEEGLKIQNIDKSYSINVVAKTITEVLLEAGAPSKIDLLSLDVEGFEAPVLRGLDLSRFSPSVIIVEARYFDQVDKLLSPTYKLRERPTRFDCIYTKK